MHGSRSEPTDGPNGGGRCVFWSGCNGSRMVFFFTFWHRSVEACFAPERRALFQHLKFQKLSENGVSLTCLLPRVLCATIPSLFQKISTSKSGPTLLCFAHFYFQMCFAPQRRALFEYLDFQKCSERGVFCTFWPETFFEHLNFQKCSEHVVFCTFWLPNVLRATTAFTFSTCQLAKVLRAGGVFNVFTSKRASRHNGVQFFIFHRARWLRTHRFSELTCHKPLERHNVLRLLYLFVRLHFFFWLFLFSADLLSSSFLFPDSSHLCFSICP